MRDRTSGLSSAPSATTAAKPGSGPLLDKLPKQPKPGPNPEPGLTAASMAVSA